MPWLILVMNKHMHHFVWYVILVLGFQSLQHNRKDTVQNRETKLTHISLATFLWDIGKQRSPKWDATDCSLYCLLRGISSKNGIKIKITPDAPNNESGLTQMITKGKSINHKWAKSAVCGKASTVCIQKSVSWVLH